MNRIALDEVSKVYNETVTMQDAVFTLTRTLRAFIGCHPNVNKRPGEPSTSLINAMFEKYEDIVVQHKLLSTLAAGMKSKYVEFKTKVDQCEKQGEKLFINKKQKVFSLELKQF